MNRVFQLALCLAALLALPRASIAQGFGQPGMAGPRAKDKNDDRRDPYFPHGLHPHLPPQIGVPGFSPNEPRTGDPRTGPDLGPTGRPTPFNPPHFRGNQEPPTADAFRPPIPPEVFAPPRFSEPARFPTAFERPAAGEGIFRGFSRGGRGILAGIGGAIAAALGGLFGRKKES
jgi:hypothetical protein